MRRVNLTLKSYNRQDDDLTHEILTSLTCLSKNTEVRPGSTHLFTSLLITYKANESKHERDLIKRKSERFGWSIRSTPSPNSRT